MNKLASCFHKILPEVSSFAGLRLYRTVCLNIRERSASSGTDTIDQHEVLWGPSVGMIPIIMRYRLRSHSMTAVMTSALADICRIHGWPAFKCTVDVTETLLLSLKHISAYYHLYDVHPDNIVHIPVQQYQLHCYTHWGLGACHSILCVCLEYLWQYCWEVCYPIWHWHSSPELTSTNSQQFRAITEKCGLLSLWRKKAFLTDAVQWGWGRTFCVMVTDSQSTIPTQCCTQTPYKQQELSLPLWGQHHLMLLH
jgi:hypothetical protein